MKIDSLGIKTDLIFAYFSGIVTERDDYWVVKTPSNPGYHWGNFLIFKNPPQHGDCDRWPQIFRQEFSDIEGINHVAFTWDAPVPGQCIDSFEARGFELETNKILTATMVQKPMKFNLEVEVKTIQSNDEWESVILEQLTMNDNYEPAGFETFKRAQAANYRKMSEAGLGNWFGAYLDGRLVADLGVFYKDDIARFQNVVTHPDFRRRGICGRLVFEAASYALVRFGVKNLVMVADEDYHAAAIYESVGFESFQTQYSLAWSPRIEGQA
ncbi:MAG: GNAT family N-acetyltransferase [Proteobacteria bacterium]|nr:GNAT family N-acetyltransferase [Pseudomonadota bacterium]